MVVLRAQVILAGREFSFEALYPHTYVIFLFKKLNLNVLVLKIVIKYYNICRYFFNIGGLISFCFFNASDKLKFLLHQSGGL